MTRGMTRVAVVGASAGGLATAEALRRGGHQGEITLVGDEPHPPYDRPPLSKQYLAGEYADDRLHLRPQADIDALHLRLRLGVPATGLDLERREVTLADGRPVPFDTLVVATGVRPRRLPGDESVAGVHVLRTVDDALRLRERLVAGRRLVIVGGGFVGAEVASTACRLGVDVTLLESGPAPLAQVLGEEAGRALARIHRERGVRIVTGVSVTGILSAEGAVAGVRLADGTVVAAEDVLVAIGARPNTEWLRGSGLAVTDGLECDSYCAAAPGVYGVGDVARWHNPLFGTVMRVEHRTNAAEQAMTVVHNILNPDRRRPYLPVPYVWSDQFETRIQVYGHLRDHDEATVLGDGGPSGPLLVAYRKAERITGLLAVGASPRALRTWRALIAARAAWPTALAEAPSTA